MPYAICDVCGERRHYRNTRGSRIADMRCTCGGSLVAAMWKEGGWVKRTGNTANAGRKRCVCAICGRNRLAGSRGSRTPTAPFAEGDRTFPAGTTVCWYHEIRLAEDIEAAPHSHEEAEEPERWDGLS